MLMRALRAILWAVIVFLGCVLVAAILGVTNVPLLEAIGAFLARFAAVIGVLAGVYHFLGGRFPPW